MSVWDHRQCMLLAHPAPASRPRFRKVGKNCRPCLCRQSSPQARLSDYRKKERSPVSRLDNCADLYFYRAQITAEESGLQWSRMTSLASKPHKSQKMGQALVLSSQRVRAQSDTEKQFRPESGQRLASHKATGCLLSKSQLFLNRHQENKETLQAEGKGKNKDNKLRKEGIRAFKLASNVNVVLLDRTRSNGQAPRREWGSISSKQWKSLLPNVMQARSPLGQEEVRPLQQKDFQCQYNWLPNSVQAQTDLVGRSICLYQAIERAELVAFLSPQEATLLDQYLQRRESIRPEQRQDQSSDLVCLPSYTPMLLGQKISLPVKIVSKGLMQAINLLIKSGNGGLLTRVLEESNLHPRTNSLHSVWLCLNGQYKPHYLNGRFRSTCAVQCNFVSGYWPLLLEKAFAQLNSYEELSRAQCGPLLQQVTGAPYIRMKLSPQTKHRVFRGIQAVHKDKGRQVLTLVTSRQGQQFILDSTAEGYSLLPASQGSELKVDLDGLVAQCSTLQQYFLGTKYHVYRTAQMSSKVVMSLRFIKFQSQVAYCMLHQHGPTLPAQLMVYREQESGAEGQRLRLVCETKGQAGQIFVEVREEGQYLAFIEVGSLGKFDCYTEAAYKPFVKFKESLPHRNVKVTLAITSRGKLQVGQLEIQQEQEMGMGHRDYYIVQSGLLQAKAMQKKKVANGQALQKQPSQDIELKQYHLFKDIITKQSLKKGHKAQFMSG